MIVSIILFAVSVFLIFYAMVGYPFLLMLIDKIKGTKPIEKKTDYEPTVTCMIVAHNEEKVIHEKLENTLRLDYPIGNLEILVASDNSSDHTNEIVKAFISEHPERKIRLYVTKEHKGKTNAQNEAQKTVSSELLMMTDANSIFKADAVKRLVECFACDDVSYVCGKLVYSNDEDNLTSDSESTYWSIDLKMRDVESRIQTITAGNGAIYVCRNERYHDFDPIECHDTSMPIYYALRGERALFVPEAVAYEKAGEVNLDEFKRKVRMNRDLLQLIYSSLVCLNVFKYGWFSFFYFGHRTCRHYLGVNHLIALGSSLAMAVMGSAFGIVMAIAQLIGGLISLYQINHSVPNKHFRLLGYYGMTVLAQYVALWKSVMGKQKAVWEKAESTR